MVSRMSNLINRWDAMRAVQGIDAVATLPDGDIVIRMSAAENALEYMPDAEPEHKGQWIPVTEESGRLFAIRELAQ